MLLPLLVFQVEPQLLAEFNRQLLLKECHPRCACRNYICWR